MSNVSDKSICIQCCGCSQRTMCVWILWVNRIDAKMFAFFLSNFAAIFYYQFATEKDDVKLWSWQKILPFTLSANFSDKLLFHSFELFQVAAASAVVFSLYLTLFSFFHFSYEFFVSFPASKFLCSMIYLWLSFDSTFEFTLLMAMNVDRLKSNRKKFARILTEN